MSAKVSMTPDCKLLSVSIATRWNFSDFRKKLETV